MEGRLYEKPEQVEQYREALTRLRVQATRPKETAAYLRRIVEEL